LIACLYVPLFPLAARLRSEPELKEEAVVICEGNGTAARVSSATRKARKVGIEPGMTLPQARARLPKLIARGRDAACERTAQQTLLEVAESFSPRVEDAGEGVVYLDLEGHPALRAPLTPPSPPAGGRGDFEASTQAVIPSTQTVILRSGATKDPGLDCEAGLSSSGSFPLAPLGVRMTAQVPLLGMTANGAPRDRGNAARLTATSDSSQPLLALASDILRAVEKAGLPGRVGVAASKLSARVAAGLPEAPTVVPEGEEQAFLAPLPLARLAPEWETAALLDRWGLRTIGDFAKLPEGEVASRLGEGGRALHASARGIDPRPLEPYLPPPAFTEGMELEWPLASLEPFLFVAHAALTRLVGRLEAQALACTRLETVLALDPDGHDTRAIQLPAPTRDVKTLLTLLRLDLEARPPGAAVAGFTFSAHPDQPRRAQLTLFGPAALSPDRLATTIARLAALLGADRVGSPRAQDGHRPERFTETGYAAPPPPPMRLPPRAGRGLLSVRVLRPPVPLEVIVEEAVSSQLSAVSQTFEHEGRSSNRPPHPADTTGLRPVLPTAGGLPRWTAPPAGGRGDFFERPSPNSPPLPAGEGRGEGGALDLHLLSLKSPTDAALSIAGSVRVAAGPWSLEEGWWTDSAADRDYWDVELSDGGLYRIYRARNGGEWFVDGVYD
jgi:nucleotidyltransferase/DNA polymerase involved in DNA repair